MCSPNQIIPSLLSIVNQYMRISWETHWRQQMIWTEAGEMNELVQECIFDTALHKSLLAANISHVQIWMAPEGPCEWLLFTSLHLRSSLLSFLLDDSFHEAHSDDFMAVIFSLILAEICVNISPQSSGSVLPHPVDAAWPRNWFHPCPKRLHVS